jgi:hypothetical protein
VVAVSLKNNTSTAGTIAPATGQGSNVTSGAGTLNTGGGTTTTTGGGGTTAPALTCRLTSPNAPRNGQITIHGTGLDETARVSIGGEHAPLIRVRGSGNGRHLQGRVPRTSNGGEVTVTQGGQTVVCGTLRVVATQATQGRGQGNTGNPGGGRR